MNQLKAFLSFRWTGIIFTLLAILAINGWQLALPSFDYDNSYSIAGAKNMADGHGYSLLKTSAEDLTRSYYEPIRQFPPGYSWLLALTRAVFRTEWLTSFWILNAIGLTGIVLIFRKLLIQLDLPFWGINSSVLFFGFVNHPFHGPYSTDPFAVLFYLCGLSLMLYQFKKSEGSQIYLWASILFFGFATYIKYLYIPLGFVPFLSLLVYSLISNDKKARSNSIVGIFGVFIVVCSLLLFQYYHTGQATYINPTQIGFYPGHLFRLSPIIPASLLNINFISVQIEKQFHIPYEFQKVIWSLLNVLLIIILFFISLRWIKVYRGRMGKRVFYSIHAIVFTMVLFGFLSVLTILMNDKYVDVMSRWVYIQEGRYFAVFGILILQFLVFKLSICNPINKFLRSSLVFLVLAIMCEEIGHGSYYLIKQVFIRKKYGPTERLTVNYMDLTAKIKRVANGNRDIVIGSNSHDYANITGLCGFPVFYNVENLKNRTDSLKKKYLIIIIDNRIYNRNVPLIQTIHKEPDAILRDSVYFYDLGLTK